jgi:hypothetical protein
MLTPFGILFMIAGMLWLSYASPDSSFADLVLPLVLRSIGLGCLFLGLTFEALEHLRGRVIGAGIGLLNMGRQLGGLIGLAFTQTYLVQQSAEASGQLAPYMSPGDPRYIDTQSAIMEELAARGLTQAEALSASAGMMQQEFAQQVAALAYVDGIMLFVWLFPMSDYRTYGFGELQAAQACFGLIFMLPKRSDEKLHRRADRSGSVLLAAADDPCIRLFIPMFAKHTCEAPGIHVMARQKIRQQRDPGTIQREPMRNQHVTRSNVPAQLALPAIRKPPTIQGAARHNGPVGSKVRGVGRRASGREVLGRSNQHAAHRAKAPRHKIAVLKRAHPDREIDAFTDDIEAPLGQTQLDPQARVAANQRGKFWCDQILAQRCCGGDNHPPGDGLLPMNNGFGDVAGGIDRWLRHLVNPPPRIGQRHRAGGALEQRHTKVQFKISQPPAHSRLGLTQQLCCAREAALFGNHHQQRKVIERKLHWPGNETILSSVQRLSQQL